MGEVKFNVRQMSNDPDAQVRQTLGLMRERVAEDSANPQFISRVRRIGAGVVSELDLCKACWEHTKSNIRFQRDEVTGEGIGGYPSDEVVETIIRPVDMAYSIDRGGAVGDCDDFSMYVACCLKALGIPCAFATVAADARDPRQFSHVYVVAYPRDPLTGQRVRMPIDASHGEFPGWETQGLGRYEEWPVWDQMTWFIGNVAMWGVVALGVTTLVKCLSGRIG